MPGATRIIAVRHGETDWNVATRIQGQLDIALNDQGRWQAQRVAQALAEEALDAVYSSDLARAYATAQAIAAAQPALDAPVQTDTGLRERGFGKFEGHTYAAIEAQWPQESHLWRVRDPHFAPLGGESPTQVMQRVGQTVHAIAARHLNQQIVLVAHGGVLDMLYRLATQQTVSAPRTWELGNTAINRLLWTPDALTLVGWADTRHLDGAQRDEFAA
jgi:2,3-bisphosphoglycerate-dependent phosphoglycerate mutase